LTQGFKFPISGMADISTNPAIFVALAGKPISDEPYIRSGIHHIF